MGPGLRVVGAWRRLVAAGEFHRDKHLGDPAYREQLGAYYGSGSPLGGPFGGRAI